jgi:hypothetical protein
MRVTIRQFNSSGQCVDCSSWFVPVGYALHVLAFDILINGCVRMEYNFNS